MEKFYQGEVNSEVEQVWKCSKDGPLFVHTTKMYHKSDYKTFDVLGKVLSGTIRKGMKVKILGEGYEVGDEEDVFVKDVQKLFILQGRYRIEVDSVSAGNLVLIEGIDQAISKTSTIIDCEAKTLSIMTPLKFWSQPIIKVSIEPLVPS
jgi:U5 small nuclear ribonucleoprotein component